VGWVVVKGEGVKVGVDWEVGKEVVKGVEVRVGVGWVEEMEVGVRVVVNRVVVKGEVVTAGWELQLPTSRCIWADHRIRGCQWLGREQVNRSQHHLMWPHSEQCVAAQDAQPPAGIALWA
jgi:hypothetical protein